MSPPSRKRSVRPSAASRAAGEGLEAAAAEPSAAAAGGDAAPSPPPATRPSPPAASPKSPPPPASPTSPASPASPTSRTAPASPASPPPPASAVAERAHDAEAADDFPCPVFDDQRGRPCGGPVEAGTLTCAKHRVRPTRTQVSRNDAARRRFGS